MFPGSKTCNSKGALICDVNSSGAQLYLTANLNCVLPAQCPSGTSPQDQNNERTLLRTGHLRRAHPLLLQRTSPARLAMMAPRPAFTTDQEVLSLGQSSLVYWWFFAQTDSFRSGTSSAGLPYFLDPTSTCTTDCPVTYFNDAVTSTCLRCSDGETHCTDDGVNDALSCGLNSAGAQTYLDRAASTQL